MDIETWAAILLFAYTLFDLVGLVVNANKGEGGAALFGAVFAAISASTALGLLGAL